MLNIIITGLIPSFRRPGARAMPETILTQQIFIINLWTALTGILPERIKAEHEDDILKTKLGCCARLEPQKDGVIAGEKRKLALRKA